MDIYRQRAQEIIQGDRLYHLFGMQLLQASEDFASLRVEVKKDFLNAHNIAHGGLIFCLLDVAFALAVNSKSDAVGVQWSFNIMRATPFADTIKADCKVIHRGSSLIVAEYTVISETTNKLIARGTATAMPLDRQRQYQRSDMK